MFNRKFLTLALALGVAGNAAAFGNDGFEEGDFRDFIVGPHSSLSTFITNSYEGFTAPEGSLFAHLSNAGTEDMSAYGGTIGSILSRHVDITAGQTLSFKWAFLTLDSPASPQYNDFSLFLDGHQTRLADIMGVGGDGHTGWNTFSWVADQDFHGNVTWVVANYGDNLGSSHLLLDDIRFGPASPVPEPASYAMLLGGMALLGGLARRRQRKG